ncbi:MAG TPA: M23 family metallopeptidase [Nocardioides sp.]|jgi:murein DD-endopeptidase MepM/ murein hydrolase activator NlpD|nr:M23 family metallopeptidase [Nocardioides sp.]
MGDHRAGVPGTTATTIAAPESPQPYVGRRIARVTRADEEVRNAEALPYVGRRVAGRSPVALPAPSPVVPSGRRIAIDAELVGHGDDEDVVGHLLRPTTSPTLEPYVGRRIKRPVDLIAEPEPVTEQPEPVAEQPAPVTEQPASPSTSVMPRRTRPGGRRAAARRARVPSLPLLAGVAVLAISAGGALQAVNPGLSQADTSGRISPASALSGSSAVGSASLLGRGSSVSRSSDRTAGKDNLQAAADAQAEERDQALSVYASQAQKRAAQIKLHQWVLPVAPGAYHLTARFGQYSYLWSTMHTGLDFAADTGTPIMAVAGGTITETGYSGAYGNRTIETLPDGTELWYCHQNSFGTEVGATVKPGQVIGYVGSTGNVTGPHLHLEVHPGGGDPVDPYTALQVHGLNP